MKPLQTINVPHEIVNDEFVTIIKCHQHNADQVKEGDPVVTIETSKMVEDLYAAQDGFVYYRCREGDEVKIGEVLVEIYDQVLTPQGVVTGKSDQGRETAHKDGDVIFSRSALRLLEELKMSKDLFKGRDFVSTEDVRSLQRQSSGRSRQEESEEIEFVKISPFKRREIEYLSDIQATGLSNVVSMIVDVSSFWGELRRSSNFFKNSILPVVLSKLPAVLRDYPVFNAFYKDGHVGQYKNIVLGMAVSLGEGLRVLRLPDTSEKSIAQIEMMVLEAVKKYVDKKVTAKEMSGVTFTVTDLSNEGVHFFVPLIPKGQAAILGVSAIDEKLERCILSLSFDHRITDGKKAGEFLRKLKKNIESYPKGQD